MTFLPQWPKEKWLVVLTACVAGATVGYTLSPQVFVLKGMMDGPPDPPVIQTILQIIPLLPGCFLFPGIAVPLGFMGVSLDLVVSAGVFALSNAIGYGMVSYLAYRFKKRGKVGAKTMTSKRSQTRVRSVAGNQKHTRSSRPSPHRKARG